MIQEPVTLTFPLFQWKGRKDPVTNEVLAEQVEVYSAGTILTVEGQEDGFVYVVSDQGQRADVPSGLLEALTMTPWREFPCRSCDTPTTHPWEVCLKCLRDPETNCCETCLRHSPGIPYPYICGNCLK